MVKCNVFGRNTMQMKKIEWHFNFQQGAFKCIR
jgi:hypothetical protein